jgi:hypothetical protein
VAALSSEELLDEGRRVIWILFREKVSAFHRLSVRVRAHCRQIPRAPVLSVESVKRATLGQQKQHWAFDSLAGFLIDAIVFDVDRYFSSTSTDGSTPPNWNPWTQASRGRYVADLIVAVDPAITPPEAGMRGPTVRN